LRPCAGMHTYVGLVEKIVSGDTLDVRIDLGFNFWEARRIRLRGVEAPGMNREAGRAAAVLRPRRCLPLISSS